MNNYHCLLFEQNDFFENQIIEELLRERANYYVNKNKLNNFWILLNPAFLKQEDFLKQLKFTQFFQSKTSKNKDKDNILENNFVSLVSTDIEFIKWIKLRLGFFEELNSPLLRKDLTSSGTSFSLSNTHISVLNHNPNSLSSSLLAKQLKIIQYT